MSETERSLDKYFKNIPCIGCGKEARGFDKEGWKCLDYPKCGKNADKDASVMIEKGIEC